MQKPLPMGHPCISIHRELIMERHSHLDTYREGTMNSYTNMTNVDKIANNLGKNVYK